MSLRSRLSKLIVSSPDTVTDEIGELSGEGNLSTLHHPVSYEFARLLHDTSPIMRTITWNLKEKMFKRGIEVTPSYEYKCENCGKEYQVDVDECDLCSSTNLKKFDSIKFQEISKLLLDRNVNKHGENLVTICKRLEVDLDIVDEAYLYTKFDYIIDDVGNIIHKKLSSIHRIPPSHIHTLTHIDHKKKYKVCIKHRDTLYEGNETKCPLCGKKLYPSLFAFTKTSIPVGGITSITRGDTFLIDGEIHFSTKYSDEKHGLSPVVAVWRDVLILQYMNHYIYDTYRLKRTPRGVLVVNTDNERSFHTAWKKIQVKLREDPLYVPAITVRSGDSNNRKNLMEFVKFMDSIDEMKFLEIRDEIRREIASFYGVSNVFLNDYKDAGGLNVETTQILVTDLALQSSQGVFNEVIFKSLMCTLGCDDFKLRIKPSEVDTELSELNLIAKRVDIAVRMAQMGYPSHLVDTKRLIFDFDKEPQDPNQGMMGGMPGMGAMPGQDPMEAGNTFPPDDMEEEDVSEDDMNVVNSDSANIELQKADYQTITEELLDDITSGKINVDNVRDGLEEMLTKIYEGSRPIKDFPGMELPLTDIDKRIISEIMDSIPIREASSNLSLLLRMSKGKVTDEIKNATKQIVRNEKHNIANKSYVNIYKQVEERRGEKFKYRWVGPNDSRSTKNCTNIKKEVGLEGVEMDKLIEIVSRNTDKSLPYKRELEPHIRCRHRIIRVV